MGLTTLLLEFTRSRPVLVVDDDPVVLEHAELVLGHVGIAVESHRDGRSALAAWRPGHYALALVDIKMPGLSGEEVCRVMREVDPATPVLLYTAVPRWRVDPALLEAGVGHLCKPVDPEAIALELARMGASPMPV